MIRRPGDSPTAEVWHRDPGAMNAKEGDTIFGGWINLDPPEQHVIHTKNLSFKPQNISCVPGSASDKMKVGEYEDDIGFATISYAKAR